MNQINIITDRLLIRNLKDSDHDAYYQIFGNSNIALYDDFQPITEEEALRNISEIKANYTSAHIEQEFAVELFETKATIGILYMKHEETRTLIGYHFNEAYHGKGYAIEAVENFILWIKSTSNKKIEALVDYKNLPSIKILKKLGFQVCSQHGDELEYELPEINNIKKIQ